MSACRIKAQTYYLISDPVLTSKCVCVCVLECAEYCMDVGIPDSELCLLRWLHCYPPELGKRSLDHMRTKQSKYYIEQSPYNESINMETQIALQLDGKISKA